VSPPERTGQPGPRREVGNARASHLHPPHVVEGEEGAPVQRSMQASNAVPPLPANAGGRDEASTDEHPRRTNDESSYEGRREEDRRHEPGDA
jgi:hypothetical protein